MSQERKKEHKCRHHATDTATDPVSRWQKFHFSGKVIMCSVLFGFGLVLIGGLLLAIGADRHDDEDHENLNEVPNKAPMSIVGPIIMGIGSFTVIVGVIMCLFETNICRKRQPDSRPLIDEQNTATTSGNTDSTPITSTSQKREKHRHHKKSPRKHKTVKKPSTLPIDMQKSLSGDFTASDKFVTPASSLTYAHSNIQPTCSDAENQTSASLMKSFMSSENTTTEFQTPASSLENSSDGSFEDRYEALGSSPETEEISNERLSNLKHEFLTPKNSSAQETYLTNSHPSQSENNNRSTEFVKENSENLDISNHDFVTPMNSYIDKPNVNAPKWNISEENNLQINAEIGAENFVEKFSNEKRPVTSVDTFVQNNDVRKETTNGESAKEKCNLNVESALKNENDFKSIETKSHDLEETIETSNLTLTSANNSNIDNDTV